MSATKSQRNSSIPADLQPFYDQPRSTTRAWARWVARLAILIIIATLAFMFVRWVWHQTHADNHKPATTTSQKATSGQHSTPITLGGSSESNTSSSEDTSDTSSTATTGGNSAAAAQATGQSSTLTNTGPGQTVGIFVASSLLFALLYELRLHTKQTN